MNEAICDIGIAGLRGLGRTLALNIADHEYSVAAYDSDEMVLGSLQVGIDGRSIAATNSLAELVCLLRVPRTVMILLPAGPQVDGLISALVPLLAPGDLVIDAGRSYFKDTDARSKMLDGNGIALLGVGMSGGARANHQVASIVAGGPRHSYDQLRHMLEDIAVDVNGEPCVAYLGPRSAGHYADMVYCGIEQGVIRLIAESYDLMSRGLGLSDAAVQKVYAGWNDSDLSSYFFGILARRLSNNNGVMGGALFELIVDESTQNCSGTWASLEARDLGVSIPTIDVAVVMQQLSNLDEGRVAFERRVSRRPIQYVGKPDILIDQLKRALYAGMISTFAQGIALLRVASEVYKYGFAFEEVARIWRGCSIIHPHIVQDICDDFYLQPHLANLLSNSQFSRRVRLRREDLRDVVRLGVETGIPVPALRASLAYYDADRGLGRNDPQVLHHNLVRGLFQEVQKSERSRRLAPEVGR